jgi:hypothetical protein
MTGQAALAAGRVVCCVPRYDGLSNGQIRAGVEPVVTRFFCR